MDSGKRGRLCRFFNIIFSCFISWFSDDGDDGTGGDSVHVVVDALLTVTGLVTVVMTLVVWVQAIIHILYTGGFYCLHFSGGGGGNMLVVGIHILSFL